MIKLVNVDKLVDYLYDQLTCAYCDTCRNVDNDSICDYCNRKSIEWSVSRKVLERAINDSIVEDNNG